MRSIPTLRRLAFAGTALLAACSDAARTPTAASNVSVGNQTPRSAQQAAAADANLSVHSMHMSSATTAPASLAPFTFRAPLEPFRIAQLPDFAMRSKDTKDIVIQQAVFAPGAGPWHTHPGPSFVYVVQGRIKLERVVGRGRCEETPEHMPGQAYYEVGNQVHRAVVLSSEQAVLMVVRFNIPVGAPFTVPAADPGC